MGSVQDTDHEPDWLAIHDTIEVGVRKQASKRVKLCLFFFLGKRHGYTSQVRQDEAV